MAALDYPRQLIVGGYPTRETLLARRDELCLAFTRGMADLDIQAILHANGLLWIDAESELSTRLRNKSMRWAQISPSLDIRSTIRELERNVADCWLAAPVFVPTRDSGRADLAAPLASTVIVQLRTDKDPVAIQAIVDLGFVHDTDWSQLFDTLERFTVDTAELDPETGGNRLRDDGFDLLPHVRATPGVMWAEFDWLKLDPLETVPGEALANLQWGLKRTNVVEAWNTTQGDPAVRVAIIDSGFDLPHEGLDGQFTAPPYASYTPSGSPYAPGTDVQIDTTPPTIGLTTNDERWHGTAVAGIVAASVEPPSQVAGIAPGCTILPIRVDYPMTDSNVAAAVQWAKSRAEVINFSITTATPHSSLQAAISDAWQSGLVICGAAGNSSPDDVPRVRYPAALSEVIAVGAAIEDGSAVADRGVGYERWISNYGPELAVLGPGMLIRTTDVRGDAGYAIPGGSITWYDVKYDSAVAADPAGNYLWCFTGTSAAVAFVSGLAALLLSRPTAPTNARVREIIESTCDKLPIGSSFPFITSGNTWSAVRGHGRINAAAAMSAPV